MPKGIIIFGAPGSGQTTIGRALAEHLNFQHFDIDDYHWRWDTEIPYTVFRPAEERVAHLMRDLTQCERFVMSGSMWSIRKHFELMFDLAVFVTVPPEVRAERIRKRRIAQWGDRVLPGGDMYEADERYSKEPLEVVNEYELEMAEQHKQWAEELPCDVICIDGTYPIAKSVELIANRLRSNY